MEKLKNRWIQLFLAVLVFILISAPQYQWALFVKPLLIKFNSPLSELQIVFSLVVVCMTFITPFAGYLHDHFNSKKIIALGLILNSSSWILASSSQSLTELYITYGILGGLGAGVAFIGCTGFIQKCFPDKRGLATGILMSGYALGPILSTYFISSSITNTGVDNTLRNFGMIYLLISFIVSILLKNPNEVIIDKDKNENKNQTGIKTISMLQTKVFWLMYFMMATIATCGMMITSNIAVIAKEYGIGSEIVLFGMAALPLALILDRVTNGLSRILFGMISDKIGRELTLGIAFLLEAFFIILWFAKLNNPLYFILLSGMVFLAWGEIFSIFPALCTDTFGEKNASVNFGVLYTSVGIGSIIGGPIAAYIRERLSNWNFVFYSIFFLDLITAVMAITLLKKMRVKYKESSYEKLDMQNTSELAQTTR